jgi:hypothetical protein
MKVLHGDEELPGQFGDLVDLYDVLVLEEDSSLGFFEDLTNELLIPHILGANPLDRDMVGGSVGLSQQEVRHTSRREPLQKRVATETRAHISI